MKPCETISCVAYAKKISLGKKLSEADHALRRALELAHVVDIVERQAESLKGMATPQSTIFLTFLLMWEDLIYQNNCRLGIPEVDCHNCRRCELIGSVCGSKKMPETREASMF